MPEVVSAVFRVRAEDAPPDLAAETLRKRLDELDFTGIFVGSGLLLREMLNVMQQIFRGLVSGLEENVGLDARSAERVRHADHRHFLNRGMVHDDFLHFLRTDAVSGTFDDVVAAPDEPEITVFVAPCLVARIVEAVDEAEGVFLGAIDVILQQSDGSGFEVDGDPAGFAVGERIAVVVMDADVPPGRGHAHGAFADGSPDEVADHTDGFRLAEALADRESGAFLPEARGLVVEGLSGGGAMAEVAEVEHFQFMENHHPVDGGRGAERGDFVFLENGKEFLGVEFGADIVNEQAGAGDPLSEVVAPEVLGPACIGDREVEVVLVKTVPELGGDAVSEGIRVAVENQFRHFAGAGSEDHQHGVGRFGPGNERVFDLVMGKRIRGLNLFGVGDPAFAFAVDNHAGVERRAVVVDFIDFIGVGTVRDHHFEVTELNALADVVGGQERGRGALDGADFDEGERKKPPFRDARKKHENTIARGNSVFDQEVGRPVG